MAVLCLPTVLALLSWRNLAIIFALLNLKSLPLAWHLRLFYHLFRDIPRRQNSLQQIHSSSSSGSPVFAPVSIFSRSPLLETDYNFHKSNSTYFSDLDISRTALVTKLYSPGIKKGDLVLEAEGHRGRMNIILGSVHASFRRQVLPYEKYEVRSRVLGWDAKWLVIGSWFIRPAKGKRTEEVLASALSKYVVKKGRFTVSPERCLRSAGLLPEKITGKGLEESEWQDARNEDESGLVGALTAGEMPESLEKVVMDSHALTEGPVQTQPITSTARAGAGTWDWNEIEKERLRGLEVVRGWMGLDGDLFEEFGRS